MDPVKAIASLIHGLVLLAYWGTAVGLLYLIWTRSRPLKRRCAYTTFVVALFSAFPAANAFRDWQRERYAKAAFEHFKKRCKEDAVERIVRVVDNVEGIFIAKPREPVSEASLRDQFWMGDPFGYSSFEAAHPAATYLFDRTGKTVSSRVFTQIRGFRFVEMINPNVTDADLPYVRVTLQRIGEWDDRGVFEEKIKAVPLPVRELRSRYAITWDDISTALDRSFWVAGGVLRVYDRVTNEVIGERMGYVIDPHLGSGSSGGRSIWVHVNHIPGAFCPPFENDYDKNKEFVAKVLNAPGEVIGK